MNTRKNWLHLVIGLLFFLVNGTMNVLHAQKTVVSTPGDSVEQVEILNATKRLTFKTVNDTTHLTIISGNVKLRQGRTLFYCDSCVVNNNTNIFEAWGHVHINDSDTTNIYASHLQYLMKPKLAYLDGGVKLTDGHGILTTPDLEYDVQTNLGIYKHGGRVINKKTVLTSDEGWYYADIRDIYFKKNVVLKDPAYNIVTDSLLYNTESQTTRFISMTTITDSSGRVVKTREGYYNQATGKAEFGQRPTIVDPKAQVEMTSDKMSIDDSTGVSIFEGNALVVDKKNKTTVIAGIIFRNKYTEAIMAIKKPLMIVVQDNDSIYITADTLFSARLTDLAKRGTVMPLRSADSTLLSRPDSSTTIRQKDSTSVAVIRKDTATIEPTLAGQPADSSFKADLRKDSVLSGTGVLAKGNSKKQVTSRIPDVTAARPAKNMPPVVSNHTDSVITYTASGTTRAAIKENDSTNRYFEAYRHVRIFNDSLQASSDSVFYSFKDSVFRLYQDPVVWAKKSQITGDTILLFTKNKKADRVQAFENSFMVNSVDSQVFNQIKSTRLDGYFTNGDIDSVRARGYAQCIYFIQDEDSAYTGINESKSDIMDIYFLNKELHKVVFRNAVSGTIWPIRQKSPSEMRLEKFRWLESRRPKSKFEMYE